METHEMNIQQALSKVAQLHTAANTLLNFRDSILTALQQARCRIVQLDLLHPKISKHLLIIV